jgi:hypothetical protein
MATPTEEDYRRFHQAQYGTMSGYVGSQPLPVDPIHTGQVGAINQNYDSTMAGIGYQQTMLGQESGFDAQGNLDPTNPYSVAANLQRRYQQGQRGTTNSMAAAGQLYSGAHGRNLAEGTYQYNRSYDSARRDAQRGYLSLAQQGQQATYQRDSSLNDANADRLGRVEPSATTPTAAPAPARVHPTKTKSHTEAGLTRIGTNLYIGPNGTKWKRVADGTFRRA